MAREPAAFSSSPDRERKSPLDGLSFTLDGELFECKGQVSSLDISELGQLAVAGESGSGIASVATLAAFLATALGMDEYLRLKAHVRMHETDDETLLAILDLINTHIKESVERQSGRPTMPPTGSSDGDEDRGGQVARLVSLSAGTVTMVGPDGKTPIDPGSGQTA